MERVESNGIQWGAAASVSPGQTECGDLHVVQVFPGGALLAVIDAIGHGAEAAAVARRAIGVFEVHAQEPAIALVERCHEILSGTRGAVMSVVSFDFAAGCLNWVGVGNVLATVVRSRRNGNGIAEESMLARAGVVGGQMPVLRDQGIAIASGDTLVMATDGISIDFPRSIAVRQQPQKAADMILKSHNTHRDDALVLVARYMGLPA